MIRVLREDASIDSLDFNNFLQRTFFARNF